jgi:D-alanyl-D-alanine-carboxypeptidase/D-alanyl-D-alanine-endopeptidase
VAQGKVQLDSPVHEFLPAGTVAVPAGAEITLLDLITQHSGLPRLPDNLHPADPTNPYADYGTQQLYQFLAAHGVAKPADAAFLYSNLGVGLLGQLLANRANRSYADLIQEQIAAPLQLRDTTVSLSPEQAGRFMQGLGSNRAPSHAWDLTALAGAGALRSSAADMLTYLQANLHPGQFAAGTAPGRTLTAAIAQSHELRADAGNMRIAFAWLYDAATGNYWHNGGTGGFTSYAFFNPQSDYAAVVLVNAAPGDQGSLADSLGQHIAQRFAGAEALSLADW